MKKNNKVDEPALPKESEADEHFPEEYEWRGGDYAKVWLAMGVFCFLVLLGIGGCFALANP